MRGTYFRFIGIMLALLIISLPVTFSETLSLQYDANGNLVTGDGKFRVYNEFNQLATVYNGSSDSGTLLEELTYHPTEERILTKEVYNSSGTLVETVIYINKNFVRIVNLSGSYDYTYVKHEGQLVGQLNPDGTKFFIHADQEGSSTVVTDEAGTIIENTTYSPFGEIITGGSNRFDYEGKEFDSVVGDYDFNFRKYCSRFHIFCQPDTLIQNVYDPQSLNRYAFERNNPYKNKDPTGHILGLDDATILTIGYIADAVIFGYYSFMAYYESDPEKQRSYVAKATLTAVLAADAYPFNSLIVPAGSIILSRTGLLSSLFPGLYEAFETYQFLDSVLEAGRIVSNQANYQNAYTHVINNPNLNPSSRSEIQKSIANTATSGNNVNWYYNPTTRKYQYWVGEGRPSNPDYQPITDGGGSSNSGSGGSSSGGRNDVTGDSRAWWQRHKYI